MLHHHSSSADMWDPCTSAPAGQPSCTEDRVTSTSSSSSHRGRLLHHRPRLSRQAGLLHRTGLSRQSGLPPSVAPLPPSRSPSSPLVPLTPSRPLLPSAAPLCAKLVSNPSSK
ncbi:Os10g0366567 [Oryza sativa Japonica Group]|uniref:Os10g0366567 protein n=1 Tax=Oryza sativa subsp. japonica TaxID=39947 RepID=A0A0P0XTL8_ORYSJ|nr:Os10g0366567 [Oryza sativa Japonica Group]